MRSATEEPWVNRRLGEFEVVRELGRGGMGIVFEARQLSLNRRVALKVLSSGLGLTSKAVQRFHREAEAAAKLHHTNIVPIYATGEQDGCHFYTMELIDGPSLDHVLKQLKQASEGRRPPDSDSGTAPPPELVQTGPYVESSASASAFGLSPSSLGSGSHYFDAVARMVAAVADALEYAHKQGVIHRDIKPSNLLLSPDGRLSVNDFGLARMLEQPGMTVTGEFVGTPVYMSPEQIAAGRVPLDHRTDVYSLGATLYELLTLQPPFAGASRDQVLAQILHKEPLPPRRLNGKVSRDLETICLKCLEKDPNRRYPTAGALAEDLRRYVNRFAIAARRAGPIARTVKWVRRRPALAAALACAGALALVAAFFACRSHVLEQHRLAEERRHEQELQAERRQTALEKALLAAMSGDFGAAEKAIAEAELLGASAGRVRMLRGQVALLRGKAQEAVEHLEQAVKLEPQSVAARALLALAYAYGAEGAEVVERLERLLQEAGQLSPITAEDYLFLGQAQAEYDPVAGLRMLDEAIRRRDSSVARLIRAEARTWRAMDTANPVDAEAAVEDAVVAKNMLPDSPIALAASVRAHLVAASAYEAAGQPERRRAVLEQAGRDAKALERFSDVPQVFEARLYYFSYVGDEEAAFEEARRAVAQHDNAISNYLYVLGLYLRADFPKALETLERRRSRSGMHHASWGYILAELPDGPARALAAYRDAAKTVKRGKALYPQTVLRLLARKAEAIRASLELRDHGPREPNWRHGWYHRLLDYNCGLLAAEDLLKAAGPSRYNRCEAHFFIGLTLLADGDRAGARDHFQKAVATRVLTYFEYNWSRAFLTRMDNDPKWPRWIAVKQ
jgi:tetratricopeptide (TPR) repeat protein